VINLNIKILLFFVMTSVISIGQLKVTERNNTVADCSGAVDIHHFKESNIQFSGNSGFLDELNELSEQLIESNSVWLRMEPRLNGFFEFELSPQGNFDFEYYLFKDNTGDFCNRDFDAIKAEKLIISDSLQLIENQNSSVSSGRLVGPVESKVNDVFYLLLHSKGEHQKTVNIKFNLIGELEVERIVIQNYKRISTSKAVRIKIRDIETGTPVLANVSIDGMRIDNQLFLGSDFIFDAIKSRENEILVNAEGYFLYISPLDFSLAENSEILIELDPLAPGKKKKIEGLKFEQNSRAFISTSYIALRRLFEFMILNKEINIEIQGHVNGPGEDPDGKVQKLSEQRARTAYLYLVENGIDKKRISYVGLSNTQMVFPNPNTEEEEEANRRVEILILK
jgi:outer membrane protein OmpA-like peptidoglycan-associated protein